MTAPATHDGVGVGGGETAPETAVGTTEALPLGEDANLERGIKDDGDGDGDGDSASPSVPGAEDSVSAAATAADAVERATLPEAGRRPPHEEGRSEQAVPGSKSQGIVHGTEGTVPGGEMAAGTENSKRWDSSCDSPEKPDLPAGT